MTDRTSPATTRWSAAADAAALAAIHREAWRYAYAGIIPGLSLERMIARRGPAWWSGMHGRGFRALVFVLDGVPAGYATLGRCRMAGPDPARGEIYELYLRPEAQGCGFGRLLFGAARRQLALHDLTRLLVWALADNSIACRFYRSMGGAEASVAQERFCGVPLAKIGFTWD